MLGAVVATAAVAVGLKDHVQTFFPTFFRFEERVPKQNKKEVIENTNNKKKNLIKTRSYVHNATTTATSAHNVLINKFSMKITEIRQKKTHSHAK